MSFRQICNVSDMTSEYRFWGVFWVDLDQQASVEKQLVAIASELGHTLDNASAVIKILSNLKRKWLLVLDNADNPDINYEQYIPTGDRGAVIITSRLAHYAQYSSDAFVPLQELRKDECKRLLLESAGIPLSEW